MESTPDVRLEQQIEEVKGLLAKHGLLESVARRQQTPRSALLEEMQRRQNLVELEMRLPLAPSRRRRAASSNRCLPTSG